MPRKKKFRTKIELRTVGNVLHVVELVGPESAVMEVVGLCALGMDAKGAGISREGIATARHLALEKIGEMAKARLQ